MNLPRVLLVRPVRPVGNATHSVVPELGQLTQSRGAAEQCT